MIRLIILISLFSFNAYADYSIEDMLSRFHSNDINHKCSMTYNDGAQNTTIEIKSTQRQNIKLIFDQKTIHQDNNTYIFQETDYTGTGTAIFIERPNSLMIQLNWEDNDNDKDKSTFCELAKKG